MIKLTDHEIERLGLDKTSAQRGTAASRRSRRICCVGAIAANPALPGYELECTFAEPKSPSTAPADA